MIKAKYSQFWRGDYYNKGETIPATGIQAERLTACGRAYVDNKSTDFPAAELLRNAGYNDFNNLPDDDKELLAVEGIGKATLKKIRAYQIDKGCGCHDK